MMATLGWLYTQRGVGGTESYQTDLRLSASASVSGSRENHSAGGISHTCLGANYRPGSGLHDSSLGILEESSMG